MNLSSEDIILFNCIGSWINLSINNEILKLKLNDTVNKEILSELKKLNERLENGNRIS